jgi:hypothetical protein
MIPDLLVLALGSVLVLLLLIALLAPMEALGWWAGWSGPTPRPPDPDEADPPPAEEARHYLVYLSGIGAIAPDSIPVEEEPFVAGLEQHLPGTAVVSDVFPYAMTQGGLTGQRFFAGVWRWAEAHRLKNPYAVGALIVNMRNFFQVAVCADQRYGPIYNLGVARDTRRALIRRGYRPGSGTPVTLLGWSGGAQIALGAATYLNSLLGVAPRVISLGGLVADDIGLAYIDRLWHLYGTRDRVQAIGEILFAGRWPFFPRSRWNRARRAGKIRLVPLGPIDHFGPGNYFDSAATLPTGQSPLATSLAATVAVLTEAGLVGEQREPAPPAR